jgi:hypothetical protein
MSMRHQAWLHPRSKRYRALELVRRHRPRFRWYPLVRTHHDGRQAFGADLGWVETLHAMVLKRKALELIGWPEVDLDLVAS